MRPLDEWRSAAQFADLGGRRIAYWSEEDPAGEKPWLLLIHGYPTSSWDWTAVWPRLADRFSLIAIDMLGFGLSDKPDGHRYTILDQADLQEAILEKAGVSEAHLFVHDYGVTVGQELLARHLDHTLSFSIKSIVFLNGGLFPEQHRARPIQKIGLTPLGPLLGAMMSRERLRKTFDEVFGPQTKASEAEILGHWKLMTENKGLKVLHRLLNYIQERRRFRGRWVGALQNATTPMRLINGGADPVSGKHLYDYYLEMVPIPDAVLLPKIGHYPHTEDPQSVADLFLEFHDALRTTRP